MSSPGQPLDRYEVGIANYHATVTFYFGTHGRGQREKSVDALTPDDLLRVPTDEEYSAAQELAFRHRPECGCFYVEGFGGGGRSLGRIDWYDQTDRRFIDLDAIHEDCNNFRHNAFEHAARTVLWRGGTIKTADATAAEAAELDRYALRTVGKRVMDLMRLPDPTEAEEEVANLIHRRREQAAFDIIMRDIKKLLPKMKGRTSTGYELAALWGRWHAPGITRLFKESGVKLQTVMLEETGDEERRRTAQRRLAYLQSRQT